MEPIVALLRAYRWDALPCYEGDSYLKPVFGRRDWKCLIGKQWTTFWRLESVGQVDADSMTSLRTGNPARIELELKKLVDPPAKLRK